MIRFAIGGIVFILAVLASFESATAYAQENGKLELDASTSTATWNDLPDENAYRVRGHVLYQQAPSCSPNRPSVGSERIEFDETLPANTTSFSLPLPSDSRLTWAKDGNYTLEGLAADGSRIDVEGFGWTANGLFCTPEEIAAAGTSYAPPGSRLVNLIIFGLSVFGVISVITTAALRRAS